MGVEELLPGVARPGAPAGQIRVELFDTAGRLVEHRRRANMVNVSNLNTAALMLQFAPFWPNGVSATSAAEIPLLRQLPNPGILLTDYAGPPAQTDRLPRGNQVGWASVSTSSTGVGKRGTFNTGESVAGPFYTKKVFDFATNQANGTFQSIYSGLFTTASDTDPPTVSFPNVTEFLRMPVDNYSPVVYDPSTGLMIKVTSSTLAYTIPLTGFLRSAAWTQVQVPTWTANNYGYTVKDGRLYWLASPTGAGTTRAQNVMSAPVGDLADASVAATLDSTLLGQLGPVASAYVIGMCWHPARGTWVASAGTSGMNAGAFELSESFGFVQAFAAIPNTVYSRRCYAFASDPAALVSSDRFYDLDSGAYLLTYRSGSTTTLWWPLMNGLGLAPTNSASQNHLSGDCAYFSHVALDGPVTKTNANTMKITYEFTSPQPAPF